MLHLERIFDITSLLNHGVKDGYFTAEIFKGQAQAGNSFPATTQGAK